MDSAQRVRCISFILVDNLIFDSCIEEVIRYNLGNSDGNIKRHYLRIMSKTRHKHVRHLINHNLWLTSYDDSVFYQLFRMKRDTFQQLLRIILENDVYRLIHPNYRGGNQPVPPDKSILIFLWYISKQATLHSIADRFNIVVSTVMQIVNNMLYIVNRLKTKYIYWPSTAEEFQYISNGFKRYPGVIGAVDGSHIHLKVPLNQHDSYINRYQQQSINLMAICTAENIFTYIFVGYPGSAHDSRVFSNSSFVQNIQTYGSQKYFPADNYHLIGDSAFPLRTWLMTPYRRRPNLNRQERCHNYCLSADRVCIENTFGILKGRFARLRFINTYSVNKAVEITAAACVLHIFCYRQGDIWEGEVINEDYNEQKYREDNQRQFKLGQTKRLLISNTLYRN